MSKIFKIETDLEHYMMFTMDDLNIITIMPDFQIQALGTKLPFKWFPPNVEFVPSDNGNEIRPDITKWSTNDLVIRKSVFKQLSKFLTNDIVETYPLEGDGKNYLFVNTIKQVGSEAINTDQTKISFFDDGTVDEVAPLVLDAAVASSLPPLFTLSINGGAELYCSDVLKEQIEKLKYKGLIFEEVELS